MGKTCNNFLLKWINKKTTVEYIWIMTYNFACHEGGKNLWKTN